MTEIEVQIATDASASLPSIAQMETWANAALQGRKDNACINIRVTDEDEITDLNKTYRNKDKPTNVLSFPMEYPDFIEIPMLGDIAICASVVEKEAREQGKSLESHWAHMVVHGTLHLLGYDHIEDKDAEEMEALEISILQGLGYKNPYQTVEHS